MTSDFKDLWQKSKNEQLNNADTEIEIRLLINGKTSGVIKKIRTKLIVEILIYLLLTYAFVYLFDALDKGFPMIVFAAAVITVGVFNNVVFYRLLQMKIVNQDLKSFIEITIRRLKLQLRVRLIFFALFISSMILLLIPDANALVNSTKGIAFLAVFVISLGAKLIFENQIWRQKINAMKKNLQELNQD